MNIPKIRFSPKCARGTCEERMKFADRLNSLLFSNVFKLYNNTYSVPIRSVERAMKQIMPEPIHFSVKKNRNQQYQHYSGYLSTNYLDKKTQSYKIFMPAEHNCMRTHSIPCFIHEATHFWYRLLNPKMNKNFEKMLESGIAKDVHDFFLKKYNTPRSYNKHRVKKTTKKFLSKMNIEQRLMTLNFIRYSLTDEIHAYKQQQEYTIKMNKLGFNFYAPSPNDFAFEEKLKMVNEMTSDLIKKERYKHAQKKAQTKREKFNNFIGYHFSHK